MFYRKQGGLRFTEKRKADRKDFVQATYYKTIDEHNASLKECYTMDISKGGISFTSNDKDLKVGTKLFLIYNLKTTRRKDRLIVMHARTSLGELKCGCQFLEHDAARDALIDTLD